MRAAALLVLPLVSGVAFAAEQPFLFDVLRQKSYHLAWEKLMKEVQPTPDWLLQFNKDYDGVSDQLTNVTVEGKPYEISYVCKPSDCAGHRFGVLFDQSGAHAVGALGGKNEPPEFFGKPSQAEQDQLVKALKGDKSAS